MTTKSDPLAVLLAIKTQLGLDVDDELIKACYQLQSEHQYDKERNTMKKMRALIETSILEKEGDVLL